MGRWWLLLQRQQPHTSGTCHKCQILFTSVLLSNSYFFATVSLDLRTASLAMSSSANSLVPVFSVPPMLLMRMVASEEEKTGKRVRGGSHCLALLLKIAQKIYLRCVLWRVVGLVGMQQYHQSSSMIGHIVKGAFGEVD